MAIRIACDDDLSRISEIARSSFVMNPSKENTGFFEIPPEGSRYYLDRVMLSLDEDNPNFYVVVQEKRILGFLMSYPFNRFYCSFWDKGNLGTYLPSDREFVFVEQIAIDRDFRRNGLGHELYQRLFCDVKDEFDKIFATISHKPFFNEGSVKLHESVGFRCVGEMATRENLTLGIYERLL